MVQKKKQLAHLFDATQCISCGACILACSQTNFPEMHNKSIPGRNWPASNIRIFRSEERSPVNLLVQCQQCENAPCVKTCPFGANYYDENGLVVQSINTLSIKQMRTQCLQASISSGRSPVPHSLA